MFDVSLVPYQAQRVLESFEGGDFRDGSGRSWRSRFGTCFVWESTCLYRYDIYSYLYIYIYIYILILYYTDISTCFLGKARVYIGKIYIYIYYTNMFRICCGFNEFVYMCWIVDMFFPLWICEDECWSCLTGLFEESLEFFGYKKAAEDHIPKSQCKTGLGPRASLVPPLFEWLEGHWEPTRLWPPKLAINDMFT